MTVAESKAAVRSYFDDFLNRGDMAAADAIFMPEVSFQYPLGALNGVEAVKGYIVAFRTAFPDVRFTVEDVFGEDDRVAARWRLAGNQTGVFRGKPPESTLRSPATPYFVFGAVRLVRCGLRPTQRRSRSWASTPNHGMQPTAFGRG